MIYQHSTNNNKHKFTGTTQQGLEHSNNTVQCLDSTSGWSLLGSSMSSFKNSYTENTAALTMKARVRVAFMPLKNTPLPSSLQLVLAQSIHPVTAEDADTACLTFYTVATTLYGKVIGPVDNITALVQWYMHKHLQSWRTKHWDKCCMTKASMSLPHTCNEGFEAHGGRATPVYSDSTLLLACILDLMTSRGYTLHQAIAPARPPVYVINTLQLQLLMTVEPCAHGS